MCFLNTDQSRSELMAGIAAEIERVVEAEQNLRADWNYRIECLEAENKRLREALEDARNSSFCTDTLNPRNCLHCRMKQALEGKG